MGDVGACWDNVVVERFFGSLKHNWVLKVPQPTRKGMKHDVAAYMRYYNIERLHSTNRELSPMKFENLYNEGADFGVSSPHTEISGQQAKRVSC